MVIIQLPVVFPLHVHIVQKSSKTVNSVKLRKRCINCKGDHDHTAFSRSCPTCVHEKTIAVKITQKISYPEARELVESRTPFVGISHLIKQQLKYIRYINTQTEFAFPQNNSPGRLPTRIFFNYYTLLKVKGLCQN